jgi:hypothetical protein
MDVNPNQDERHSRWADWTPVIQTVINGAVRIILQLVGQGRHPL